MQILPRFYKLQFFIKINIDFSLKGLVFNTAPFVLRQKKRENRTKNKNKMVSPENCFLKINLGPTYGTWVKTKGAVLKTKPFREKSIFIFIKN
jgi:hypothetical protein